MTRPQSSRRYHGHTEAEAEAVRADRERASRWVAWVAIAFVVAAFAPHVWRAI
jgi:hypothetical protein